MQVQRRATPLTFVVDDESAIREYVAHVAKQAGFVVETAGNGRELLDLLDVVSPTVIMLDLQMPAMDGIQAMHELALRHVTSKIVILSGSDPRILETAADIARQRGLDIAAVLQKPIRKNDLLAVLRKLNLESEAFSAATLRSCLDQNLLTLNYQPKISLKDYQTVGCEALLRCTDPAGRVISPEMVVGVAEGGGMIEELSDWVFREALAQRQRWDQQGLPLDIAINLSARTSFNRDLPELFTARCAEYDVPTEAVTIELTESSVMNDQLVAMETMVRLRLKGFKLSIDDFGTGYSSLLRLKQLPFTEIKVDKSFVTALHQSRDNAAIVKAIIQLATNLEMRCVIEGIEDQQALDFAAAHGCDQAQGYFIAKPLQGYEIDGFLKTWHWRRNTIQPKGDGLRPATQDETMIAEAGRRSDTRSS